MKTLSLPGPLPFISAYQGLGGMGEHKAREALASVLTAPILDAAPNKKEQVKYPGLGSISIGG